MDRAEAEIDLVTGIDIILEVLFQMEILDIRGEGDVVVIRVDPDLIAVFAVDEGGVGEEAAIEDMIPAGRTGCVAVVDTKGVAEA